MILQLTYAHKTTVNMTKQNLQHSHLGPLAHHLGPHGEKPGATALLTGTLPPQEILNNLLPGIVTVLEVQSKAPLTSPHMTKAEITPKVLAIYKASKESTSSFPSGHHIWPL
jgi:hypothetical protein